MDMNLGKLQETALQGGLACCSPRGHKESDTTWRLNNSNNMNRNSQISLCRGGNIWRSSPSLWLHTAQTAWLFLWFLPSNSWVLLDSCWFSQPGSPGGMLWVSISFPIRMRQPRGLPLPLAQYSWAQQSHPASWVLMKCPRYSISSVDQGGVFRWHMKLNLERYYSEENMGEWYPVEKGQQVQSQEKESIRCDEAIKRFGALLSTGLIGGIVGNEARKVGRRHDSIEIP